MMKRRCRIKNVFLFALLSLSIFLPNFSIAQDYPNKPINILSGFAPGGSGDASTRILTSKAEKYLGQPIIITHRVGGVTMLAASVIAKAKPDGYNIAGITPIAFSRTLQLVNPSLKIDDLVPIMYYGFSQTGNIVKGDAPWKTFRELVEYAKKNPGKIKYGSQGAWSVSHTFMELVALQEGIQWTHIPFQGSPEAISALLGGHIDMAGIGSGGYVSLAKTGTVHLLAVHSGERVGTFLDVPTLKELGYDLVSKGAFLFAAPRGTPLSIVNKLDETFGKAMNDPEFIKVCQNWEILIKYGNSEATRRIIDEDYREHERWIKILKIPQLKD